MWKLQQGAISSLKNRNQQHQHEVNRNATAAEAASAAASAAATNANANANASRRNHFHNSGSRSAGGGGGGGQPQQYPFLKVPPHNSLRTHQHHQHHHQHQQKVIHRSSQPQQQEQQRRSSPLPPLETQEHSSSLFAFSPPPPSPRTKNPPGLVVNHRQQHQHNHQTRPAPDIPATQKDVMAIAPPSPTRSSSLVAAAVAQSRPQKQNEEEKEQPLAAHLPPLPQEHPPQHQQQPQQLHQQRHQNKEDKITPIHGIGLWDSWTRNFESPLLAVWDLLDNAIDAACPHSGKVHLDPDVRDDNLGRYRVQANTTTGLLIQNTCQHAIAPLDDILKAYKSSKIRAGENDSAQSMIGENGVGIKQGCATLSDLSFVLVRNSQTEFGLGVLAKNLQKPSGIYLPSWTWNTISTTIVEGNTTAAKKSKNSRNKKETVDQIKQELYTVTGCQHDVLLQQVFATYGGWEQQKSNIPSSIIPPHDFVDRGVLRLAHHYQRLCDPDMYGHWGRHEHVFCLVLHNLIHDNTNNPGALSQYYEPHGINHDVTGDGDNDDEEHVETARQQQIRINNNKKKMKDCGSRVMDLLLLIEAELPKQYLHISHQFDLQVNRSSVRFSYWQRRLVDLTQFTVLIDTKFPTTRDNMMGSWTDVCLHEGEYELRVYLGFDPLRAADPNARTAASLVWYSRKAGRLVKQSTDARAELNLTNGGTEYCQGLTILVDDAEGWLPLNPTKQDFAFGERATGAVHRENLKLWISAVAVAYYNHHKKASFEKKAILTQRVLSLHYKASEYTENDNNSNKMKAAFNTKSIAECKFTRFEDLEWSFRLKKLRLKNKNFTVVTGKDTIMELPPAVAPPETVDPVTPDGPVSSSSSLLARKRKREEIASSAAAGPAHRLLAASASTHMTRSTRQQEVIVITSDTEDEDDDKNDKKKKEDDRKMPARSKPANSASDSEYDDDDEDRNDDNDDDADARRRRAAKARAKRVKLQEDLERAQKREQELEAQNKRYKEERDAVVGLNEELKEQLKKVRQIETSKAQRYMEERNMLIVKLNQIEVGDSQGLQPQENERLQRQVLVYKQQAERFESECRDLQKMNLLLRASLSSAATAAKIESSSIYEEEEL